MNPRKKPSTLSARMACPTHPVWGIAKGVIAVSVLAVILYFSANRFDNTEIGAIGWFAAIYAIVQGSHEAFKKFGATK